MIAFEEHSRLLLIVHAVLGAALVAAATHLAVWTWGYWRGVYSRHKGARRFAWITVALFAAELLVGLVIYPTYKVRARVEYLDEPTAIVNDYRERAVTRERVEQRVPEALRSTASAEPNPGKLARVARWFDVKEHWVGVGFALALGLAIIMSAWSPKRDGDEIARVVAGMALVGAGAVWLAAIVGLVVTSFRSIGA